MQLSFWERQGFDAETEKNIKNLSRFFSEEGVRIIEEAKRRKNFSSWYGPIVSIP